MASVSLHLDDDVAARLQQLAELTDHSKVFYMVEAITHGELSYLNKASAILMVLASRVPITLIGRLAVDNRLKGQGRGASLLSDALRLALICKLKTNPKAI